MTPSQLALRVAAVLDDAVGDSPIPTAVIERRYMPIYDLSQLTTLRCPVVPTERHSANQSRAGANREHAIGIGPQWKASLPGGVIDEDQCATFIDFVNWIDDTLERAGVVAGHTWISSDINPLYDLEQLRESSMLTSLVTVTYRTLRRV